MPDLLKQQLIAWRRDFHRYPEQGFLEIRTASRIAAELARLGYRLRLGRDVMSEAAIMGKPDAATTATHAAWARAHGADPAWFDALKDGYTAVVADWDSGKPGPTTVLRVDMDALPIDESDAPDHLPQRRGFRSENPGSMHACGHDGHSAIGLAVATLIAANRAALCGTIRLIFQPAEEGVRGGKALVAAGVVDDADYFIALHLGLGVPQRSFVAGAGGFLASSKLDITYRGVAAHAGGAPQDGKNALLAAASAALNLHAIPRHSAGASRINVGELHAGSGRNIIADHATLKIETRGANASVNDYLEAEARRIIAGAAQMYGVEAEIRLAGQAIDCRAWQRTHPISTMFKPKTTARAALKTPPGTCSAYKRAAAKRPTASSAASLPPDTITPALTSTKTRFSPQPTSSTAPYNTSTGASHDHLPRRPHLRLPTARGRNRHLP